MRILKNRELFQCTRNIVATLFVLTVLAFFILPLYCCIFSVENFRESYLFMLLVFVARVVIICVALIEIFAIQFKRFPVSFQECFTALANNLFAVVAVIIVIWLFSKVEMPGDLSGGVNLSSTGARPPETGVKNFGSISPSLRK